MKNTGRNHIFPPLSIILHLWENNIYNCERSSCGAPQSPITFFCHTILIAWSLYDTDDNRVWCGDCNGDVGDTSTYLTPFWCEPYSLTPLSITVLFVFRLRLVFTIFFGHLTAAYSSTYHWPSTQTALARPRTLRRKECLISAEISLLFVT